MSGNTQRHRLLTDSLSGRSYGPKASSLILLGVADAVRVRPLQLTAARLNRRFYGVGGITTELSS